MARRYALSLMVTIGIVLVGCTAAAPPSIVPDGPRRDARCPKVESVLMEIATSPDSVAAAARIGVEVKRGRIPALITVSREELTALARLDVEVTARSAGRLEGTLPLDRLCQVAELDEVVSIQRVPTVVGP